MRTALLAVGLLLAACHDERRRFGGPGGPDDDDNAQALSDGSRLFDWMNCSGCHSHGGGGMGPALIDEVWLYGSSPEAIHASIAGGRPNGMPAFAGLLPDGEIWKLVAYVRSLGGEANHFIVPARADHLHVVSTPNLHHDEGGAR